MIKHFIILFSLIVIPSAHGVLRFELDGEIIIKAVIQIFLKYSSYNNIGSYLTNAVYNTYILVNTIIFFFFSFSFSCPL